MNPESVFPVYCLSMLTWVSISQLLLLTFDRVIRRHEKEVMLQNPGFWEPARREVREVFCIPTTRESSLLGGSNLVFPNNVTRRSARTASTIVSDPFRSRRSSWSSRIRSRSYTERELSSGPDPMRERPAPSPTLSTMPSCVHPPECLASSPDPSSPRSTVASSTHTRPGQSRCNGQ